MDLFKTERRTAQAFPPGEFIKDELEARGWSQSDLAEIIGRNKATVNLLISGKQPVNPRLAKELGAAFSTSAEFWMNLETSYRLWLAENADHAVSKRAEIYSFAPVKELIKRNWIEGSDSAEVLEMQVCKFFGVSSLNEQPSFAHAARKGTSYESEANRAQLAWLFRAREIAKAAPVLKPFSTERLADAFTHLRLLLPNLEDVRLAPKILAEAGIRMVVIEHLPQTKIDGAAFWLEGKHPVVALSLRYDRLDGFWFTLFHEMKHVERGDGKDGEPLIDVNLIGDDSEPSSEKPPHEQAADREAAELLVPKHELDNFVARVRPFFSEQQVFGFAARMRVHPAIVVGQLHHRKALQPQQFRKMQLKMKARDIVTKAALTDGWGQALPANF